MKLTKLEKKILVFISLAYLSFALNFWKIFDVDEGVVLAVAWELYNNKVLYYDIFEFVAPGSFYMLAFLFKLFGPSYYVAKFVSILFFIASWLGIFKTSEYINKNNNYIYLSLLIFILASTIFVPISYYTYNLTFLIWSSFFFVKGLNSKKKQDFIISGSLASLATIMLQHRSIVLIIVSFIFLLLLTLISKKKRWIKLNFSYLIASVSLWPILLLFWPFKILYNNLIVFPLHNYTEIITKNYTYFYIYLIQLIALAVFLRKDKRLAVRFLIYLQFILLFSTVLITPDLRSILLFSFPLFILIPIVFLKLKKSIFVLIYLCIFLGFSTSIYRFANIEYFRHKLASKNYITEVAAEIDKYCQDDYIYAGPFLSNIYFETKKLNPGPHVWLITNHHTKQQFEETVLALQEKEPDCAIISFRLVRKYNYNEDNPVDNFIRDNYFILKELPSGLKIYKHNKYVCLPAY